ncbi:MAG: hypothetical protein V1750_01120 [Acidobacteriota bacterium]
MHITKLGVLAVAALTFALLGCSKELKPDHRGVFLASGEKLQELSPVGIDSDFTPEGFLISYFSGEPGVTGRISDTCLILYGDYKPFDLRAFANRGERYEIDSTQPKLADSMEAGGMRKEPEMTKVRFTKPLKTGVYVLDVQQADGSKLQFAFRVE